MKIPEPNQRSGPLVGHVRQGRVYKSPIAATGMFQIGDWVRDDLPDLLWPVLVAADLGTTEMVRFVRWQGDVQADLSGVDDPGFIAECLDGRLTNLDRLVARLPEAQAVVRSRAQERGLLSDPVTSALKSYSRLPAAWLVDADAKSADQGDIDCLARALLGVLKDGHREAVIKCLRTWSAVQAGTFRSDSKTIEMLKAYPKDPETRSMTDSAVRAMWGASKAMLVERNGDHFADSIRWAKVFWGINSMTTRCVRRDRAPGQHIASYATGLGAEADPPTKPAEPGPVPDDGQHLYQFASDLLSSYVEALENSPARLYDPERQEVHAGLVCRAGRDVITALGSPDLWCMEHGSHVIRALVEVRIYLEWMAQQDPSIYRAFQDYGAGKAKLYARIMEELPAQARNADFEEAVKELEKLSYNHDLLDYRVVDTRDSFAGGKSIRAMAEECGLLDLYRQAYSVASGVAHSEWWSVETHAMERCLNVLHGGHLIPSLSLNSGANVPLASSWIDQLYALMRISLRILGTDEDAVAEAFAWLADKSE